MCEMEHERDVFYALKGIAEEPMQDGPIHLLQVYDGGSNVILHVFALLLCLAVS